jgi:UDP-N-acetylmuramyl pentapeptide synthase
MAKEKIVQFNETKEAGLALQNEIKEGDIILVDGSKEMSMIDIIKEIRSN